MKIKLSKNDPIITALCFYFMSKMLWDSFLFGIFEAISLMLICYAIVMYFIREIKYKNVIIIVLFATFSGYILIDCIFKCSAQYTFRAIYEYIFYSLMIFAMSYYLGKCKNIEKLIQKIHAFGFVIVALSWYEYLTKNYLIGDFHNEIFYSDATYTFRAAVFSRSYLSHGMVIGFVSLCAYYLFLKTNNKAYLLSSLFCWVSILTTSSRGPLVATFLALILAYIINQYRISKKKKKEKRVVVWLVVLCLLLAGVAILKSTFTVGNETINYFLYRARQIINWTSDAGNVGRLHIWQRTIEWFKTDVFFGIGPSKTGSWGEAALGVTESGVLKRLCELGIIGFTIYYLFIFFVMKKGIKNYKSADRQKKINYILYFSIVICVLINDITLQSTEEIIVSFIYAFGLGGLMT